MFDSRLLYPLLRKLLLVAPLSLVVATAAATQPADTQPAFTLADSDPLFSLIDHTGKQVTDEDFRGEYLLVYFGYAHCPDVCPAALHNISQAMKQLSANADRVQPVFITVDPKRDTVEFLADYVRHFHPRFVGLTGDKFQIFRATRTFRVRYFTGEVNGKYEVSHTDNTYLLGPDGKLVSRFPSGTAGEEMAKTIVEHFALNGANPKS